LSVAAAVAALFLNGCANDLAPVETDRPPAPYSADPIGHIPQQTQDPLGAPRL
jgi:PBP1b-binding outer membrane lipoprotein LpoB